MKTHTFEGSTIPGASVRKTVDGQQSIEKLKTPLATFTFRPVPLKANTYTVQVTCKELPGLFKNSGTSSFGWFTVIRHPGRNEIRRPRSVKPISGNATLMWPNIQEVERQRCLEYIEKVIREGVPRLVLSKVA